MKINNDKINLNGKTTPHFGLMPMNTISKALYTLGNNDMLNASAVDIFAMDTPRTIVEYKNRGKNAGIEMGFREYTGTFIAEFSAAVFALLSSKLTSKLYKPDIKINSNSWATNKALDTFNEIYKNSDKTPTGFVSDVLSNLKGIKGKELKSFADIPKEKAKNITDKLADIISNTNIDKKQLKNMTRNVQDEIIEAIGADNNIILSSAGNELKSNLSHTLRDTVDLGKNVFFKEGVKNSEAVINKLKTINKSRIMLAIPMSMTLALTNQYINRKLTKKRTGIDNFVGENNYEQNVKEQKQKENQKGLWAKKALSAGVFVTMLTKVMGVKKPSDFINKLEFDGPATGGNAIKTIYGTLILGRIFASKDSTELRETNVRDYLGFLNWLVLGGFVSKGVAQAMDTKKQDLFNITKEGKGISHWLKDVSLKSQKEIIAQGGNVSKNLMKLNIAQMAGIAYSAIMLGVLLPKLNIFMTKHYSEKDKQKENIKNIFTGVSMQEFENNILSAKS